MATKNGIYRIKNSAGEYDEVHLKTSSGQVAETQDKLFVSTAEKTNWNSKANGSHNHTLLTGVTSIAFSAESSDTASITTNIDSLKTYFDFNLSDDLGQGDQWRWRFTPNNGTVFDAMTLKPISAGKADLSISGELYSGTNKVYHAGNKPTLSDLGAAASSHTHTVAQVTDAYKIQYNTLAEGVNLDEIYEAGWYSSYSDGNSQTIVNRPPGTQGFVLEVHCMYGSGISGRQIQIVHNRADGKRYQRYKSENTAWSAWELKGLSIGTTADTAAAGNHTHSYIGTGGGNVTGNINFTNDGTGVTLYQGGKLYKKVGDGVRIVSSNNSTGVKIMSTDESVEFLTVNTDSFAYKGNKVYHAGDKPTLAEIGAAPSSGSASITNVGQNVTFGTGDTFSIEQNGGTWWQRIRTTDTTDKAAHRLIFEERQGANDYIELFGVDGNGELFSNGRQVYHTGFKPSASDIGAASTSHNHDSAYLKLTGGTVTGSLTAKDSVGVTRSDGGEVAVLMERSGSGYRSYRMINNGGEFSIQNKLNEETSWTTNLSLRTSDINNLYVNGNAVYHVGNKPTYTDVGAASSNHTHSYVPVSTGGNITITADSDSSTTTEYAMVRAGGNELRVTSSGGGTSPVQENTKLTFNGNVVYHAGNKPTASDVGASPSTHNHDSTYLNLSGDTMTGAISTTLTSGTHLSANQGKAIINSLGSATDYTMLARMKSTNGVWTMGGWTNSFNLFYTNDTTIAAGTNSYTSRLILLDESGNSTFPGTVKASSFTGNASSATKLATARTINGVSFDGTSNITIADDTKIPRSVITTAVDLDTLKTSGIYEIKNTSYTNGPGSSNCTVIVNFELGTPNQLWIPDNTHILFKRTYNNTTSSWNAWTSTLGNSITGSAASAVKLSATRTVQLTGAVTGSVTTDFSGSTTINTTANHEHNNYVQGNTTKRTINLDSTSSTGADTIRQSGFYRPNSTQGTNNAFPDGSHPLIIHAEHPDSNYGFQIAKPFGDTNKLYFRARSNSDTWGDYYKIYHTGNNPTAADVGAIGVKFAHQSDWTDSSVMTGKTYFGGWHGGTANGYFSFAGNGSYTCDVIVDGEVYAQQNKKVYHENNKPTPADIGAATTTHTHANADITSLDASKLTGTINIDRLPQGALERCIVVANDTARYALTSAQAQKGDTVKVVDTGIMYFVMDETKLSTDAGYEIYTAGAATSVPWSGILDKPTSMKNPYALTVSLNGTSQGAYDGSEAKAINITPSSIGASAEHTHPYIPTSGSTAITGNLEFTNSGTALRGIVGIMGDNDYWRVVGGATSSDAGFLEIATADGGNEPIYVRQYSSGKFATLARTATLLDASGNTSFPGTVSASSFIGNASTASALNSNRTIKLTGAITGTASTNLSGDVTIETADACSVATINKTLTVTTAWQDTGITGANIATGSYMLQISGMNNTATLMGDEIFTGTMSWYAGVTNSTESDEIILHKAGNGANGRHIFLRTIRSASSGYLKLQICASTNLSASSYTFKFRQLI